VPATFDAVGPGSSGFTTVTTPYSWSHTVAADATLLIVGLSCGADSRTLTVTAGGTAMTTNAGSTAWKRHANDGTAGFGQLYVLPAPPAGAITIAVSGQTTGDRISGGSMSFKGTALDSTAYGTPASAAGFSATASVAVSTASSSNLVAAHMASGQGAGAVGGTSTSRFVANGDTNSGAGNCAGQTAPATGGSVTMSRSLTSDFWAIFAIEVIAAAAGGGPAGQQPHGFASSRRRWSATFGGVIAPPLPSPAGTAPDHLVIARRASARGQWRGPVRRGPNAAPSAGPAGTAPDHLVISRRYPSRAVWRGVTARTVNLLNGSAPDHLVIARRSAARAVWHGNAGVAFPNGTAPDRMPVCRRAPARAAWRGTVARTVNAAPSAPVNGTAPDHLTVARRAASRGLWRGTVTRAVNAVQVPLAATGGLVRRRRPARGQWAAVIAPPRHAQAATGGLARRRVAARASWRGWTSSTVNAPPPPFTVGKLTAGTTLTAQVTSGTAPTAVLTAETTRGGPG
jgi:hypothetical protein